MAIEPENTTERKKLAEVLDMLKRQDPTFHATESSESGQTIISGMGELHLEVIKNRLVRDFHLNVKFYKPRVSYRETIASTAEVTGQCNRQVGSQNLFARLQVRFEPLEDLSAKVIVLDRTESACSAPKWPKWVPMKLHSVSLPTTRSTKDFARASHRCWNR
jgi:elongation factor G